MRELGRLERMSPRDVWLSEPRDFTPWLLEHADHLADALGIDLELQTAEHPVGGFSLDLIGSDLTNDAVVIVENQLEGTDHDHLGKLLTYAAGTGAATIVWIATDFREEHRPAIDWLNERTDDETHFFGVQVGVVRIADSLPAPVFDVVAMPNEWQKRVRAVARAEQITGKGQFYVQFWSRFLERVQHEHPDWTRARRAGPDNWMTMPSGISGTVIGVSFASGSKLRHELYIDFGDAEQNLELLHKVLILRNQLESAYGRPLEFEELPKARACRIADYHANSDVNDVDRHEEFIDWFFDSGVRLRHALAEIRPGVPAD